MPPSEQTLDTLILNAVRASGAEGIRVIELISTLPSGTSHSIRGRVKALKALGSLVNTKRGRYVTTENVTPIGLEVTEDDSLTYPIAPNGHEASETGRDSEVAAPRVIRIPPLLMRRLMGGRLPLEGLWSFASGTSMEPFIPNGSPIFIEPAVGPLIDGERYAIWLGEAEADVVKRIELDGDRGVVLRADNPRVSNRLLVPTEDPSEWRTEAGGTIRMVVRGRVTFPLDTPSSVVGTLEEFARALIGR